MSAKGLLLASSLVLAGLSSRADASVMYEVYNPVAGFVFFKYVSPHFITSDISVPGADLAYNNTVHPARQVDFILDSPLRPGFADIQITIEPFPNVPTVQNKFLPAPDLAIFGNYQFALGSFGYPNSYLDVTVPEPVSLATFGVGLAGLAILGVGRRRKPAQPSDKASSSTGRVFRVLCDS